MIKDSELGFLQSQELVQVEDLQEGPLKKRERKLEDKAEQSQTHSKAKAVGLL